MAKRGWRRLLLTGWRKWVVLGVGLIAVLGLLGVVVDAVAGKDLEVWWVLRGMDDDMEGTLEELKQLGRPYKAALGRAVLRGGRSLRYQMELCWLLHDRPFYGRDILEEALRDDDPLVKHAAVAVLLNRSRGKTAQALPDDLLQALRDWCGEPADAALRVGIAMLHDYRDPRIVDVLLPLLKTLSQDVADDKLGIGRANSNRQEAAKVLKRYISDPRVLEVFEEVVARRDGEADMVQFQIWKALASQGYAEKPEMYWIAARSDHDYTRQAVAEHLERVAHPEVIEILKYLLEDRKEVVRRGALNTLMAKKSPVVMDEIFYLAEDSYSSIKGDLATAVGSYGRKNLVCFLAWCLLDNDSIVVEKSLVELRRLTREHYGFNDEQWDAYTWNRPLEGGTAGTARTNIVKAFMNDEARQKKALAKWAEEFPPRYRDRDRVVHLVRQLGHADRGNVKRAVRELVQITGRSEGFPPALLDAAAPVQEEADAMYLFMTEQREKVIEDWRSWLPEWEAREEPEPEDREPPEDDEFGEDGPEDEESGEDGPDDEDD